MANIKRKSDSKQTKTRKSNDLKNTEASTDNDVLFDEGDISDEEGGTRIGDIYIPPPLKPYCSAESKGPRLIITQIENENFKSYAGKVVLGPFHHCFTAIIGPNGSGKSNVIDSMLFVFGYRAQKIRCKKLSVLLHNSAKYPNMQMCSVAVHFKLIIDQEDETCVPVENTEIIIARTAFKDNSSYYTINGKRVQFKEVSKLLKNHGVDLDHNRFLILQGEVESIAMMKSKGQTDNECGMLEYLEDIVGTTRYKEPLLKINSKVEILTEERTRKHNRCKLAEREMKDLEQPYNDSIEFLKLTNTCARSKNLHIQKNISEENKKLQEFCSEKEVIDSNLKDHDKQYEDMIRERREKETLFKQEVSKIDEICKNKDNMEQQLNTALNNFTETKTNMVLTNKRRKENKTQLQKKEEKLIELKNMPTKNEKEIVECEKKVEKLSGQKNDLENQLQKNYAKLEEQTKPLIEKRVKIETELVNLKKIEDDAKAELTLTEQELRILKQDETSEIRKFECLKGSIEESKSSLEEKKLKIEQLISQIPEIKKEIEIKLEKLRQNKTEEETIRRQLINLKADISEKVNSVQLARSNNKVLDSLMQQKVNGNIPGILGRLGDLGGIDAKYDIAISTACGRLDNIIVENVNTAQACIEYLKKYDVGRASFIALEKVQHLQRYCTPGFNAPENVPRLFDLVRVEDQRILPAFYFALRNTLVAKDLDQGTRIAYGATRYRVVTLQGDVIETSGTMSGGGRTQIKGRMGEHVTTKTKNTNANKSIISQKGLEELQSQAENLQSKVNYLQQEQGIYEKEIQQLQTSMHTKEAEKQKLRITAESLEEQLPRIEKQLKSQQERVKKTTTDPKKVKNLEEKITIKRKEYEKSEEAANKLTKRITDINKSIADIHGDQVKSVQNKINNLTKQINSLNANVSKLKVEISSSERTYKKISQEIDDLKIEIKTSEDEIRSLSDKHKAYDEEGVEWTKKIEIIKKEIEDVTKNSSIIQKEILAIQAKENDGNLKRVEIEQKLEEINEKISNVKIQLPQLHSKLKPLKLHEIPGETIEPFKTYTEDELNTYKLKDLQYQCTVQYEKLKGKNPNLSVIQEYTNKREIYLDHVQILEDITSKRNEMRQLYEDVRKKRYTEFMKGFHIITRKLKEMYQMITQGGDAELELVDSMDPFTEGVTFSVRPPKKTWKNISNLSGGEKTLSSLALVFALHYYKPSPLYFMDEIDAALDFKNISIVAHYIKERTKNAQFIIISLRSNMFELSDYIVGIYKVCDCTNSLTVRNYPPVFINILTENPTSHNAEFDSLLINDIETNDGETNDLETNIVETIDDSPLMSAPLPNETLTAISIE